MPSQPKLLEKRHTNENPSNPRNYGNGYQCSRQHSPLFLACLLADVPSCLSEDSCHGGSGSFVILEVVCTGVENANFRNFTEWWRLVGLSEA